MERTKAAELKGFAAFGITFTALIILAFAACTAASLVISLFL